MKKLLLLLLFSMPIMGMKRTRSENLLDRTESPNQQKIKLNDSQYKDLSQKLIDAIENNDQQTVLLLLKNPYININSDNERGETLLHFAIVLKHNEIVRILVQNGADMHRKSKWGKTPLHYASLLGHFDSTTTLVENGANVLALDQNNKKASEWNSDDSIGRMLLAAESNLTAVANHPSTKEEELNESFAKAGLELTVPKDAYFKMLYHGAPIKLTNNDQIYFIDLCTVYKYFIENNKLDELKALVQQHGFTYEQCKKLGWGFFPNKNVIAQQERLLTTQQNNILTDVIVHCKK